MSTLRIAPCDSGAHRAAAQVDYTAAMRPRRTWAARSIAAGVTALALGASAAGCGDGRAPAEAPAREAARRAAPPVPTLTVAELAARLARGGARAVDANGEVTRKRFGTIPGAILLSDYETFLPSELPPDRGAGLIFYCASDTCSASDEAAARAVAAGYTDVHVLAAGITGWVRAGQPTARL
jgi:rhodanese-related sulfurtransferase